MLFRLFEQRSLKEMENLIEIIIDKYSRKIIIIILKILLSFYKMFNNFRFDNNVNTWWLIWFISCYSRINRILMSQWVCSPLRNIFRNKHFTDDCKIIALISTYKSYGKSLQKSMQIKRRKTKQKEN